MPVSGATALVAVAGQRGHRAGSRAVSGATAPVAVPVSGATALVAAPVSGATADAIGVAAEVTGAAADVTGAAAEVTAMRPR